MPAPDDLNPDAAAELRHVRAEIAAMREHLLAVHARVIPGRHGWLGLLIRDLETNPHTQYKVHFYGVLYWLVNFPLVTALFFFEPTLWLRLGVFITLIYSIYANMATDYGAMSAAMAAFGRSPLPEVPLESHVDVPGQQQTTADGDGHG